MSEDDDLAAIVDRFDHVSIVVTSLESASPLIALVGGRFIDGGYEAETDFHWVQYDLPHWGRLELITTDSRDPEHFINRFIRDRGEGLHHLTFKVADIGEAVRTAEGLGLNVVGYNASNPAWKEAFIHPRSANGVLIQLAESADTNPTEGA